VRAISQMVTEAVLTFCLDDRSFGAIEDEDSDFDADGSTVGEDEGPSYSFPELDSRIREVIEQYDGSVFPKLNWSSPQVRKEKGRPLAYYSTLLTWRCAQDAAWMNAGPPLQCRSPADVYLLLKSSDFVSYDLAHAFDDCVDDDDPSVSSNSKPTFELVLKKWFDMPRSQEFRCFVRDRRLLGAPTHFMPMPVPRL
jgi:hypothetical protein